MIVMVLRLLTISAFIWVLCIQKFSISGLSGESAGNFPGNFYHQNKTSGIFNSEKENSNDRRSIKNAFQVKMRIPAYPRLTNNINNDSLIKFGEISINRNQRSLSFPVEINRADEYIEVILCRPEGKLHESMLVSAVKPVELQAALILLGFKPLGNKISKELVFPELKDSLIRKADSFFIFLQWVDSVGISHCERIENFIYDNNSTAGKGRYHWFFNGLLADEKGNFISDEYYSLISTLDDLSAINVVILLKPGYCIGNNCNSDFKKLNFQKGKKLFLIIKPA